MSVEAQPSTKNKEEGYCGNELSACLSQGVPLERFARSIES